MPAAVSGSSGTTLRRSSARAYAEADRADAFPHTRRPLPWFLAGFLLLLFLVPIDSTEVRVHLPVDSHLDRFALLILAFAWFWYGGDRRTFLNSRRSKLFVTAVCIYTVIAVASVLLDAPRIINLGEFTLAEKRFATLGAFIALGWFALSALRREDLYGIASYLIGLGTVTALGVLLERRTGYNAFYNISAIVLKPFATVAPSPTDIHPLFGSDGRVTVVGPTVHGLAVTALMTMVIPFALVRMLDASTRRRRLMYAGIFLLLLAGAIATDKKTAVVVPVAMVAYIMFYRRRLLKLMPLGLVIIVAIVHVASPGSLGAVFDKSNASSNSTTHRIADFSSVMPDILAHPLIGRGFGTLDPDEPTIFRINDNEYVDEVWEVGILGLVAYMWMILAPIVAAQRAIRSADPVMSSLALSASAGCVGYLVVSGLFDATSFVQAPYIFFIVASLATIASGSTETDTSGHRRSPQMRLRRSPAVAVRHGDASAHA